MRHKGVFIGYKYIRKQPMSGQIAVLFTLMIGLVFLFVSVTLNTGMLAQRKTQLQNAADSTAATLSSGLSSMSYYIKEVALGGKRRHCERISFSEILEFLLEIVWIIIGIVLINYGIVFGAWMIASGFASLSDFIDREIEFHKDWKSGMRDAFKNLDAKSSLQEMAVYNALSLVVDDAEWVVDEHDYDRDGDITDKIERFGKWYIETRIIHFEEDINALEALIQSFMGDLDEFGEYLSSFYANYCTKGGTGEDMLSVFEELEASGFPLDFWQPGEKHKDEVDILIDEIELFLEYAGDFLEQEIKDLAKTVDLWRWDFYNPEADPGEEEEEEEEPIVDHYITLEKWIDVVEGWVPDLIGVYSALSSVLEEDPELLLERLAQIIEELEKFQEETRGFCDIILQFHNDLEGNDGKKKVNNKLATYTWTTGSEEAPIYHHARVEVSELHMPHLDASIGHGLKRCVRIAHGGKGGLSIDITRYDGDIAGSWWSFVTRKNPEVKKFTPGWDVDPNKALPYGISLSVKGAYSPDPKEMVIGKGR